MVRPGELTMDMVGILPVCTNRTGSRSVPTATSDIPCGQTGHVEDIVV